MDTEDDQDNLYRIQLMQAFGLEIWNGNKINITILELYNSMKTDPNLQTILKKISEIESSFDCERDDTKFSILFTILFQYDYFDFFHKCIIDYVNYWTIRTETMEALLVHIQKVTTRIQ